MDQNRREGAAMTQDPFRLDGQTALVTGCRRASAWPFAEALARPGADIIGVSASLKDSGEDSRTTRDRCWAQVLRLQLRLGDDRRFTIHPPGHRRECTH